MLSMMRKTKTWVNNVSWAEGQLVKGSGEAKKTFIPAAGERVAGQEGKQ